MTSPTRQVHAVHIGQHLRLVSRIYADIGVGFVQHHRMLREQGCHILGLEPQLPAVERKGTLGVEP